MKAVLFDFNGTLFDDTRFHLEAWQNYLMKKFGIEMSLEEIRRSFIGPNNSAILKGYFGQNCFTEEELVQLSCEKEAEYRAVVRANPDQMRLIDGAFKMFDALACRGIPFALATASIIDNIRFYLDDLGLDRWFTLDRIVYDEGRLPSKPDPAFYLEAAARLNMDIADCIIVEDSPTGIEAAVRAGAGGIVVMDRTTPLEKIQSYPQVSAVIHDFHGFEHWMDM